MDGLKSFLIFNDLSQLEVAHFLGISKGQMSKLVSGVARLQDEQLEKLLANPFGWNTEFLTNPMWGDLERGKLVADAGGVAIQQNGKQNKIGKVQAASDEVAALRKEIDLLRAQVEELKAEKAAYWEMIKQLTAK
ncbi:MAG: hypothetical protein II841_08705 [Bacteroidales bacterium]|nr:hypothetical protein [Bacteroidales bacterium]